MAETYYFSHDYNARSDKKIKKLIKQHEAAGYGIYWMLVEDLYNNDNNLPLDFEELAYDLRVDEELIKSIVTDFDLFTIEDDDFGSLSIQKRLDKRSKRSKIASENAHKRWNNATALQTKCKPIAIKEKKGKEIKESINAYDFLKEKAPQELEIFEMQNKKTFNNYQKFIDYFNNKVTFEEIEFKTGKLISRLRMLNDNWEKKPKRNNNKPTSNITS